MKNEQQQNEYYANIKPKLMRDAENRKIAGVCGGLAKYFKTDVSMIRIAWFLLAFFGIFSAGISTFLVVSVYFVLWMVLPKSKKELIYEAEKM